MFDKRMIFITFITFLVATSAVSSVESSSHNYYSDTIEVTKVAEVAQTQDFFVTKIEPEVVVGQAIRVNNIKKSTTTITSPPLPSDLYCPDYYLLAKEVGWPEDQLVRLDYVMWRESRCDSSVHNTKDPVSGSRGLIQINGFWCRPNRWTKNGYLQDNDVLKICEDLFDPAVSLRAGLSIYNYSLETHRCGWGPWSTKKNSWCR